MEQRISWWIVSSGERGEIVKRPTSGLIVSGISNWPVAISREETGSTTGSLPSTIPPPPFSLSLSLSLSLPACSSPPRFQPRVTCCPFLVCIASSSLLLPPAWPFHVHVPPSSSSRWLLVSTLHFSVYAANCTATASICEGRARSRQAFLPVARCGA